MQCKSLVRTALLWHVCSFCCAILPLQSIAQTKVAAETDKTVSSRASLDLHLRYQQPVAPQATRYHSLEREETWKPSQTAVVVCDMWDSHHCVNAVRRVSQLAPRVNQFCRTMRELGATIIHAPSGCMDTYQDHPARSRARETPQAKSFPKDIATWCDQIPSEEQAAYPLDQAEGGEDDDPTEHAQWAARLEAMGRNPGVPWREQVSTIQIAPGKDLISDNGREIWSILEHRQIQNVMLVGVHTNMCVLGRPFGLRRLSSADKNVVLVRDLTDTMYDPRAWPFASHFTGTDLIVGHIEKYVCPTITSNQITGGAEFRFRHDQRQRVLMVIAEDEYQTEQTLPHFAAKHLSHHFSVTLAFGSESERHLIPGLSDLSAYDALLISVRRRALPQEDMQRLQEFVASGKPVIGIRTASHAFSLRGKPNPEGTSVWDDFDAQVFGGSYSGHYGNDLASSISLPAEKTGHELFSPPIAATIEPGGSLYRTAPLKPGTRPLLMGTVPGEPTHPVAWTFVRGDGGRSFYTSLGHKSDFEQASFEYLLSSGIHWACNLEPHTLQEIETQNARYSSGRGRQRR